MHLIDLSAVQTPWEMTLVVRHTAYDNARPEQEFDLMRAYADPKDADAEAARLNAVARPGVTYFVKVLLQRTR